MTIFPMKTLRILFIVIFAAALLHAGTPLTDVRMSGANNQVQTGATLTINGTVATGSGGTVPWQPSAPILTTLAGLANSVGSLTNNGSGSLTWSSTGGGSGTVTSITAGTGLTGGTITTSGTIGLGGVLPTLAGLANSSGSLANNGSGGLSWTGGSGGGFSNPMTAVGDLVIGGTAGAAQRLGIGSSGQVLTVASGAPAWVTPSTVTSNGTLVKLSAVSIGLTETTVPHGLSSSPSVVLISPRCNTSIWVSTAPDATNLYLTSLGTTGIVSNSDSAGLEELVSSGETETVISSLTITPHGSVVVIHVDLFTSQYINGQGKSATIRIRRTSLSGDILASNVAPGNVDSVSGDANEWNSTLTDSSVTDGTYLLTVQETSSASCQIWSATRSFSLSSTIAATADIYVGN